MNKYIFAFGLGFITYDTFLYFKARKARKAATEKYGKAADLYDLSARILLETRRSLLLKTITPELEAMVEELEEMSDYTDSELEHTDGSLLS